MKPTEQENESEQGDGIATPVPLAATEPRHKQRFTITGYPGWWVRVGDVSTAVGGVAFDVSRPRDANSVLAVLGERLVEFQRDLQKDGSEI